MGKRFKSISKIVLINIYFVILAGSVVRMTGSGMGCPDWPKCFGYYIPPTSIEQLLWTPNREFKSGQMIIKDNALFVCTKSIITTQEFNQNNWEKYTQHDYAKFNAAHTWTEYINRLTGALLGLFIIIMTYLSFRKFKINKSIFYLCLLQVFLVGFQAWLGKLTVDSNLQPLKITIHMLGALLLILIQLIIHQKIDQKRVSISFKNAKIFIWSAIMLLLIQIILGTQVREQVDLIFEKGVSRVNVISELPSVFYIHRSFSILITALFGFIIYKLWGSRDLKKSLFFLISLLGIEILAGVALTYFNFPAFAQPIHILTSTLIFGVLFFILLKGKLSSN